MAKEIIVCKCGALHESQAAQDAPDVELNLDEINLDEFDKQADEKSASTDNAKKCKS